MRRSARNRRMPAPAYTPAASNRKWRISGLGGHGEVFSRAEQGPEKPAAAGGISGVVI
jgi:hypothetical protein